MPGLSQYDRSDDASPQARQRRGRLRGGARLPESELQFGWAGQEELDERGWSNCWCHGELCLASKATWDWVGKDAGLPHPKTKEELALRVERMRIEDNDD